MLRLRVRVRPRRLRPKNTKPLRFLFSPFVIFGVSLGRGRVCVDTSSHRRPKPLPQYMWGAAAMTAIWYAMVHGSSIFKWTAVSIWFILAAWLLGFLKSCAEKWQIAFGGKNLRTCWTRGIIIHAQSCIWFNAASARSLRWWTCERWLAGILASATRFDMLFWIEGSCNMNLYELIAQVLAGEVSKKCWEWLVVLSYHSALVYDWSMWNP